jgi:hypothetical protein
MLNDSSDERINNYGTYRREQRRYGPGDAPPPKREHDREQPEIFDDPIPVRWTGRHVGRRLVDAFNVLHRMPPLQRPKDPGGNWPPHGYSKDDLGGWSDQDKNDALMRTVLKPTRAEITRMEGALEWLRWLKTNDAGMALQLMFWANTVARHRKIERMCIEKKWCRAVFYRRIHRAKDWIARQLNGRHAPVY